MNRSELVTLIIPTYRERHEYLRRSLGYYRGSGVRILVCDSSEKPFPGVAAYHAEYMHVPGMEYKRKLFLAVERTRTPYVLLCGDDDFSAPDGILAAAEFLEAHPGYSTAQGRSIHFFEDRGALRFATVPFALRSVEDDLPSERLLNLPGYEISYALHRRDTLLDALRFSVRRRHNNTMERALQCLSFIRGKNKVLPAVFSVREFALGEKQHRDLHITDIRSKDLAEYRTLLRFLARELRARQPMTAEEARGVIHDGITNQFIGAPGGTRRTARLARYYVIRAALLLLDTVSERAVIEIKRRHNIRMLRRNAIPLRRERSGPYRELGRIRRLLGGG